MTAPTPDFSPEAIGERGGAARDPRFQRVDGTSWTVDVDGEIQWRLRYGDPAAVRMLAASLASQFAHICDPSRPLIECMGSMRRARQAVAQAAEEVHAYD